MPTGHVNDNPRGMERVYIIKRHVQSGGGDGRDYVVGKTAFSDVFMARPTFVMSVGFFSR